MQHLSLNSDWVLPIAAPGHGIIFPQRGLGEIPPGAIAYLLALGYLVSSEPQEELATEPKPKRAKPKTETPNSDTPE